MSIPSYVLTISIIAFSTFIFGLACAISPTKVLRFLNPKKVMDPASSDKETRQLGIVLIVVALVVMLFVH